jgi:hypothetical protein
VCGRPECQRRRRSDYHRKKLASDPEYHQVALESQKQWREEHPDYQKHRRQNQEVRENNRQGQRRRDQKRRLRRLLDKNNLALDLKHSASEVWLLGPELRDLDKNNLASAQVLILPSLSILPAMIGPS